MVEIVQTVPKYTAVFKHLSIEGQQAFPIHIAVPNASLQDQTRVSNINCWSYGVCLAASSSFTNPDL